MLMIGILGEYLWRNLEESRKNRYSLLKKNSKSINELFYYYYLLCLYMLF